VFLAAVDHRPREGISMQLTLIEGDIFYPGNPKRRERAGQLKIDCVDLVSNFNAAKADLYEEPNSSLLVSTEGIAAMRIRKI
jgi:hypothetical protein